MSNKTPKYRPLSRGETDVVGPQVLIVGPPAPNAPGPGPRSKPPKETAPDGTRRFRRRLRLGLRMVNVAGPRRLRCAACFKCLNRKTRRQLQEAVFVFGYGPKTEGLFICNSHTVYRQVDCPHCKDKRAGLYAIPGPTLAGGTSYVDSSGQTPGHCPWCWKPLK